jgi:hypothetical protein
MSSSGTAARVVAGGERVKSIDASGAYFFAPNSDNESQSQLHRDRDATESVRCLCGALLARWVATGLELTHHVDPIPGI